MGTITELATTYIVDNSYDPKEFTEVLNNPVNFKGIDKALLDVALMSGFEPTKDMLDPLDIPSGVQLSSGKGQIVKLSRKGQDALADYLIERIETIEDTDEKDTPSQKRSKKKRVKSWVEGSNVPRPESAIKICFALGLDDEQSQTFFRIRQH